MGVSPSALTGGALLVVTPLTFTPSENLVAPLWRHAAQTPQRPLLAHRVGDGFVDVTAREVADRVRRLAAGLIAIGVEPGDRVALMCHTRLEWTVVDYAIQTAGAATVPIYETSSAEQIEWIVSDSGAVALVAEAPEHAELFDLVADRLPRCRHVFVIDAGGLDDLAARGADVPTEAVEARVAALEHDDVATIIYTSGTTGRPKGCVLTQGNLCTNVAQAAEAWDAILRDDDSTLLFLPLAHSFAKTVALVLLDRGIQIAYATDQASVPDELPMFSPTLIIGVPRVYERVYNKAQHKAAQEGKSRIFGIAVDTATAYARQKLDHGAVRFGTRVKHAIFDKLVYGKLRAAFGGGLRVAVSAGAPLGERLGYFFNGVGVTLLEGYGLTETSPVLTANFPDDIGIGTVGYPVPGTEIRVAADGEILARGPQIFQGYWHDEAATKEVIDEDGWFHTGDLGELDAAGRVRITGRAKDLIITAGGKNVSPATLEDRLRAHPLISDSVVVGDNRPFIAALVALDAEALRDWAAEHGKASTTAAELRDDPELRAVVDAAVAEANGAVSRAEEIRRYTILPRDLSIAGGELTPTMKVRRATVMKEYGQLIEELYLRS
jgi:long-chain acyl-CoA synthetase